MSSGKITKKYLKRLGLLPDEKSLAQKSYDQKIEEGKNKHRLHLQMVKNELLKQERLNGTEKEETPFFNFRSSGNDYSSFKSLLSAKDWEKFDSE